VHPEAFAVVVVVGAVVAMLMGRVDLEVMDGIWIVALDWVERGQAVGEQTVGAWVVTSERLKVKVRL
jgi:hypothetical protein